MTTDSDFIAKWYREVIKPQVAHYNERMRDASPYRGSPKWEREAHAAERELKQSTAEAGRLYTLAHNDIETIGEVSEAVWFALDQFAVGQVMQAAE